MREERKTKASRLEGEDIGSRKRRRTQARDMKRHHRAEDKAPTSAAKRYQCITHLEEREKPREGITERERLESGGSLGEGRCCHCYSH